MQPTECLLIEPVSATDIPVIQQLATRIWNQHYPGIISREQIDYMLARDYSIERLKDDLTEGVCIDKVLLAGEPVGFCAYGPTLRPGEVKLHKIYIESNLHSHGIGSRVLTHVESKCAGNGFCRIVLQVNRNNLKAIRAYLRNGYHVEADVVSDIGEGFVMDDHLMVKAIAARDDAIDPQVCVPADK